MQNFRETDSSLVGRIAALQDKSSFKELHWEGSFEEYLKIVRENPRVTRTAFQRIYDMILSHGKTEYIDNKKKLIRYHFFHDEHFGGRDAVYGLDVPRVKRLLLSEKDRIGIGTFQPKDEKNQDSTELTGDVNYRKIAEYGSDSDPRAFNFDGEFNIANRGIIEFVEVLKLDVAFLYDLLGATQERKIKPKKFAQTDIDEVILGHTNEAEYKKLLNNEFMEALRDRTVKIDIPYITKVSEEVKIYLKDFAADKIKGM